VSFISACFAALTASALPGATVIADAAIATAASALAAPRATSPSAVVPSSRAPSSRIAARAREIGVRVTARAFNPFRALADRALAARDRENIAPSIARIAATVAIRLVPRVLAPRSTLSARRRASRARSRVPARARGVSRARGAFCGAARVAANG
tara:strand:- start:36 stop:500 length:465 start_codon:yes stop_codon:yes gene_type:complete